MRPNALSCACAYTDAQVKEPASPCAATWPIVNFSTVKNFALNKLAYILSGAHDIIQHWIQGGSEEYNLIHT